MTTTETVTKTRGRPRAFDEDQVLDTLVDFFWIHGYEAASMNDIVDAAGLNKSSLYNAFGSKDELFFTVLDRYIDGKELMLREALSEGGVDALVGFFASQREMLLSTIGKNGCMAVNASTELGLRDERAVTMADRYRAMLRESIRRPLVWSADRDEVDPLLVDAYTEMLVSAMFGMSVSARAGASEAELETLLDSMVALITSWKR
ncbi:MAG: TetR/AcrR family transcriptional regulator [Actinomycetota bacterium]